MRTIVLCAIVGASGIAAFAGGIWLARPDGAYMPLDDEQVAMCKATGGCTVTPVALLRYMHKQLEQCKGNDKDRT
jgi:hypothetical protein